MRGAGLRDERHTSAAGGQLNAKEISGHISHASGADELLALFAAHSARLNHIHAANLWNKLGKQRIERRHEERLEQLVRRTLDLVPSCNARSLANIAHGVAKCGLRSRLVHALYEAVAEAAVRGGLAGFNPQNLANTVWAYATAGVAADALYAAVAEAAVRGRLAGFNPQALANTVWAYATAGVAADALYAAVADAAVRGGLAGFKPQDLANTVWAYAAADHYDQALLADCSRVISDSLARDPSRWSTAHRSQLHQWQLWLSLERGKDGQRHLLHASQRQLCCDAMVATIARPSGLQRSVAAALAAVRSGFEEEHLEPRTGYSLDLALPSSRIAIEVDGPSHFLLPDGRDVRKPNGPTLLKRRLLTAAGWRVISVPFYEWDGFATASERRTYLQGLLAG